MTRLGLLLSIAPTIYAHDPITTKLVWTREISRLMNRHCISCHRERGAAMPLETYEDARPWAKAIRDEVASRRMPPWGPVKGVGEFRGDPSLSQIEIDMIVNWVEGGAPKGDDVYLPAPPRFADEDKPQIPAGREQTVESRAPLVLRSPVELAALRPVTVVAGASLEVTACLPNGAVERLIWIRRWRPEWQRSFVFLHPVRLPEGTRIAVYSDKPASVAILLPAG